MNLVDKVISEISNKLDVDKTLVREELSQGGKFGHVSLKTFNLSEKIKKSPEKLTEIIEDSLKNIMPLTQVSNIGPYINLNFNGNVIAEEVIANIRKKGEDFGSSDINKDKLYLVEYSSPNIGKPLHVGHIRSTVLGDSISNILRFTGAKTYDINYLGDTGLHIGKIIAAFNLWGSKKDFDLDPENTMLNLYVRFSKEEAENPKLSILANEILEKIEAKIVDPDTHTLVEPNKMGEIWLNGKSVASGYWRREAETKQHFQAKIKGSAKKYFRTGDLGFIHNNEIFITGRLKELLIIHGKKYYPTDLEQLIKQELNTLSINETCAVFGMPGEKHDDVIVMQEIPDNFSKNKQSDIEKNIRNAIRRTFGLELKKIMFLTGSNNLNQLKKNKLIKKEELF